MIQTIRGFRDLLPGEIEVWQHIESAACSILRDFGFREIRIPIMEKTELFSRSIGEDTDIVEKEMYTFTDRNEDSLTLRPEATASVIRAYIQHKLYAQSPFQKLYTLGPMFRRERPQKGRYRQFYQINAEVLGVESPYVDAQLIAMLHELLTRLSISDVEAHINSLGCPQCRPAYKESLIRYIEDKKEKLCADCVRRSSRNPLRVLDCKVPSCREALENPPAIADYLCQTCRDHFGIVQASLNTLNVPFILNRQLVRGLDYYQRTTFEIQTGSLGAQNAVAGGGRYDGLIQSLGGPNLPGIGFAIGLDRLVEISGIQGAQLEKKPVLFIAALGTQSKALGFEWSSKLCRMGIQTEMEFEDKSLKSQMKLADRIGAVYTLIIGENEIRQGEVVLRDMKTKSQVAIPLDNPIENIRKLCR